MIVAVVVGGAILIGSMLLFGPIGLLFAIIAVPIGAWLFGGSWTTISDKDREHARKVDIALGVKKTAKPVSDAELVEQYLQSHKK